MVKKGDENEEIELAEEHIKIASDIVCKQAKDENNSEKKKELEDACLSLERAEADLEE